MKPLDLNWIGKEIWREPVVDRQPGEASTVTLIPLYNCLSVWFGLLLFYDRATVFQSYRGGDMMYKMSLSLHFYRLK